MTTNPDPIKIAMLIYPEFTALDLVGPHQFLCYQPGIEIHLIAKTADPVVSDGNLVFTPDRTFETCDDDYDVLFVPGGLTVHVQMEDAPTLACLARIGATAKYITAVCTGPHILAAAGLLTGYKVTGHWAYRDILAKFEAIPTDGRFVIDRNRLTGGGVTSGVDFGLHLLAHLRGDDTAKLWQLVLEYDPKPPFNTGSPKTADAQTKASADEVMAYYVDPVREAAERASKKLLETV